MEIELPTVPLGLVTILSLLSPYLIAIINAPKWSAGAKKLVAVAASLLLTLGATALYYVYTKEPVPDWPVLLILGILVSQMSYNLLTKGSASELERRVGSK